MLFHDDIDEALYALELKALNEIEGTSSNFIKKSDTTVQGLKDFLKSQSTSREWQQHRSKYMFAIRKFHRSMEGSKLHRKLSRFFSMRDGRQHTVFSSLREELPELKVALEAERAYYHSLLERAQLELLIEEISSALIIHC